MSAEKWGRLAIDAAVESWGGRALDGRQRLVLFTYIFPQEVTPDSARLHEALRSLVRFGFGAEASSGGVCVVPPTRGSSPLTCDSLATAAALMASDGGGVRFDGHALSVAILEVPRQVFLYQYFSGAYAARVNPVILMQCGLAQERRQAGGVVYRIQGELAEALDQVDAVRARWNTLFGLPTGAPALES